MEYLHFVYEFRYLIVLSVSDKDNLVVKLFFDIQNISLYYL